jgi:hypothetical protein
MLPLIPLIYFSIFPIGAVFGLLFLFRAKIQVFLYVLISFTIIIYVIPSFIVIIDLFPSFPVNFNFHIG